MTHQELAEFIQKRMRMSHIYQPVMLLKLLQEGGQCSERAIAESLLSHDVSQLEYYENIVRGMVGAVLRRHKIVERDRKSRTWSLLGFDDLSSDQVDELSSLCRERLNEFVTRRGDSIFEHRKRSKGAVSGTLKYEVLKRARFRCELCGVMDAEKALEVDHIVPRNFNGSDDISNLQALCYSCNAMKRDRDDTDFRGIQDSYDDRRAGCAFCEIPKERIISENELAIVIRDAYPVTELHTLVIPKRHVQSYFDLGQPEINACTSLLRAAQVRIGSDEPSVDGFNIGINDGESAGQTVFHCHIHLIPRRAGDVQNPKGGIRNTLPGKGDYTT